MGSKKLLAIVALVLAGLLVWQIVSRRGGTTQQRSAPARSTTPAEDPPPLPPEAPEPEAEADEPGEVPAPAKDEGIRVRVLAGGQLLTDAHVYAMADDELHELGKEEPGTWFAGTTGDLTVGAAHALHGPARKKVRAEKGVITEVTLELPAGETLDVLVLADPGGAPVAGASVRVLRAGGDEIDGSNEGIENSLGDDTENFDVAVLGTLDVTDFMMVAGAPSVAIPILTTDATGRARVAALPPGTVDIVVSHKDFVPTRLRRQPVGKEAVARLSAGGSLTVLAPYVDGRAAEGYLCGAVRPGLMLSMPVGSAKVDAGGKAFFPHLPPGPLRILVAKARHPLALMTLAMGGVVTETNKEGVPAGEEPEEEQVKQFASGNVTIAAGEHATLDLREAKGARIEGVFVAGDEAKEGAMILLQSGDQQVGMQMAGEEGKFAFEGVAPGRYRVSAAGGVGGTARAECEVREGDKVVTVRLEFPAGSIAGRILGADGKPAKGNVFVAPRGGLPRQAANLADLMEQLVGYANADEEGRFRVQGIPPGDYRVLGAVGQRLDIVPATVREGEEVQVELRVDDARVRRLLVKLEGAGRKPVEGSVRVLGSDGGAAETLALTEDDQVLEPPRSASHEFFLAPGRYRLVASAPGLAPALGEPVEVAGDREVTLTLGPGVRVEIVLEGSEGPLANRDVDVRNEHGIRLGAPGMLEMLFGLGTQLRTDGGGILTLDAVPPGKYALSVDGRERGRFDVASAPVTKRIRVE